MASGPYHLQPRRNVLDHDVLLSMGILAACADSLWASRSVWSVELAPALGGVVALESGSKLRALQTLRAVRIPVTSHSSHMSAFDDELAERLGLLREQGLHRQLRRVDTPQSPCIRVEGRELLNFSSNDYLGLANEPALKEAAIGAI